MASQEQGRRKNSARQRATTAEPIIMVEKFIGYHRKLQTKINRTVDFGFGFIYQSVDNCYGIQVLIGFFMWRS
jgi:hypothetical protein